VRNGSQSLESAYQALAQLPFSDLGYARVDHHRALRQGFPEVIFGAGKQASQIIGISERMLEAGENVLVTRVTPELAGEVMQSVPALTHNALGRTLSCFHKPVPVHASEPVAVVTAGTSDAPVAEEALETLRLCGVPAVRVYDVGVAGIHRLLERLEALRRAPAVIVIAGMEGALPSVVGGLLSAPIIAVPTSVGYGTALAGFTALFSMLTSCASGITVVNIDNGFGAALAVARLLSHPRHSPA
jgi:pyridinium-3,5-biscarboxylic acid mononucleotide synthase